MQEIITMIIDIWVSTTITIMVLYFAYRYFDEKIFASAVKKARHINNDLESQEIKESKIKTKKLQKYIDDHKQEVFDLWIDRISVWLAHNWVQDARWFHFLFYSLIAEAHNPQLNSIQSANGNFSRVSYHTMVEYEELAIKATWWRFFTNNIEELWPVARSIAKTLWSKSICVNALYDTEWEVKGLLICSSVFDKLETKPNNNHFIENIRSLLI